MTPYTDIEVTDKYIIREFNENIDPIELMWHRDLEDRTLEIIGETNWKIQFDDSLPILLENNIFIPKYAWHRVIKGTGNLRMKIMKPNINENKLRTFLKTEIRKALNEQPVSTIYKVQGILTTDTSLRNQTEILSDVRSITGVTIVSSKETGTDASAVDNQYYHSVLSVKIDPHPYIGKGGFGKEEIKKIINDIKKIKGVRNFKLTSSPIKSTI
jgi:hypothetical protein